MKKIKLLTGLGAATALGVGAVATTSCTWSYKKGEKPEEGYVNNGDGEFKSAAEVKTYAKTAHFVVENMNTISVNKSNVKADLLDKYVKAGQIADGFISCMESKLEEEGLIVNSFKVEWTTTDNEMTLIANDNITEPDKNETFTEYVKWTYSKANADSSYFDHVEYEYTTSLEEEPETHNGSEIIAVYDLEKKEETENGILVSYNDESSNPISPFAGLYLTNLDFDKKITVTT